jgi:hypothetical protein
MRPKMILSYEQEMLNGARAVARLQAKRRTLRRKLREVEQELRHEKKMLRALINRKDAPRPDVMPSRLFNGATAYAAPTGTDDEPER